MAEFKEVMKNVYRIHKSHNKWCMGCPLSSVENGTNEYCMEFLQKYPEEAEKIISKWTEEHPVLTNADKFEQVFGVALRIHGDIEDEYGCNGIKCPSPDQLCDECKYSTFWYDEYKEPKHE